MPLLLYSHCPKQVQISGLGTGTWLSYAQTSQAADLEMNIQSSLLLRVGTHGNALKCHITSTGLWLRLFTHQSVDFQLSNSDEIITQWSLPMRLINFILSYGKIMTSTVQPVITHIYLCERICASCLSYFSNLPSVMDQKLN